MADENGHPPAVSPAVPPVAPPVVLVTGGAAGIGRAIADRFARGGYAVAVVDHDAAAAEAAAGDLRAFGVPTLAIAASVADEAAVEAAVARTVDTLGGLDVAVNNAGVACNKPALELGLAEWQRALDVNLTGVFLCARAAGRRMVAPGARLHPQYRIDVRHGGRPGPRRLLRDQERGGHADPRAGRGMGRQRRPGQRYRPRLYPHPPPGGADRPGACRCRRP